MVRVLVFGTGNVGAMYGFLLQTAGAEVTCVCRSKYETAKREGFTIQSTIFGTHSFRPQVVQSVQQAAESDPTMVFDFILVCTKAASNTDTSQSPPSLIQVAVRTGITSIVIIQNGLGVEKIYQEAFPDNTIISGVTYMPVTQVSAGVFAHTETQRFHLGVFPAQDATSLDHRNVGVLENLLKSAGARVEIHQDVQTERWAKLVSNATWNPICALSRCRDLEFLRSSPGLADTFINESMREVVAVATVSGYGGYVAESTISKQMARSHARRWPGVEPSMLADIVLGKSLEVEVIVGDVVKIAREKGVDVPRLETLFVLLRAYEWILSQGHE